MRLSITIIAAFALGLSIRASTLMSDPSKITDKFFEQLEHGSELRDRLEWDAQVEGKTIKRRYLLIWMIEHDENYILIFEHGIRSWPGGNNVTVALTDKELRTIDWLSSGGEPMFHWAHLVTEKNETKLKILARRRAGGDIPMVYTILVEKNGLTKSDTYISKETRIGKRVY